MSGGLEEALRGSYFSSSKYTFKDKRITEDKITELKDNEIFVFGSNLAGRHGKGAAKTALQWGAEYGKGVGLQGKTYAIPTKDDKLNSITPIIIGKYIGEFILFAGENENLIFLVTEIGCGWAGYSPSDIAPFFESAKFVTNIHLPVSFWNIIDK